MIKTSKRNFTVYQNSTLTIEVDVATALDVDPSQLFQYTFAGSIFRYAGSSETFSFTTLQLNDRILTATLNAAASLALNINKYQYQITATKAPDTIVVLSGIMTIGAERVTISGNAAPTDTRALLNRTVVDPTINIYTKPEVDSRINEAVGNAVTWTTNAW